jgi:hypothetical protein
MDASTGSITPSTSTPGTYTVTYTIPASGGCSAVPVTTTVTINPLPVPTITGPTLVCNASTGNVYTTQAGMTGYIWTVTGGTITSGTGTNAITVTWNTPEAQTVTVNYTDTHGCTAASPTVFNVTVTVIPTAAISYAGNPFCVSVSTPQLVTLTGTGAYLGGTYAAVPAGLTIDASTGSITPSTSTPGTYTVTYTIPASAGCSAVPVTTAVTINPLPVPTITGPTPVCETSTGNVYTTQAGMTGYIWTITGGTITGGSGTNAITVTWNTPGSHTVTVNYTDTHGCTAASPTIFNVTVTVIPTASISYAGNPFCVSISAPQPVTLTGTGAYLGGTYAAAPAGLTIDGSTGSITPSTSTPGTYTVTYTIPASAGCSAVLVTTSVTINSLPTCSITGADQVCPFSTSNIFTATSGMSGYAWTISGNGSISGPADGSNITVTAGSNCNSTFTLSVTITDSHGCVSSCSKIVLVQDLTPPFISSCPSSITTLADLSQPYATISLPPPVYSDNCTAIANISVSWTMTAPTAGTGIGIIPVPFHCNIGTTTVTYTITDACGNASTCTFNVTVASNYPPVITCPTAVNTLADPGLCSAALDPGFPTLVSGTLPVTYSWIMAGASVDSGSGPILPNPYTFNVGTTTIIWRATNIAGFAECSQNITVEDDQPPTFAAPMSRTYCVHQIDSALYWNPTMDIKPDRPEYYIFKSGTTDLDLDPATFADNCPLNCSVEIRWRISFADGSFLPTLPSLSITGQPSSYPSDIIFPGSATDNVIHTITYQIIDCHGNVSLPLTINITILLRPIVTKNP